MNHRPPATAPAAVLTLLLAGLLAGCTARPPAADAPDRATGERPLRALTGAATPADVLVGLEKAVETRDVRDYDELLAASFRFVPFDGVVSAYPEIDWSDWDRVDELAFARWLTSPVRTSVLRLQQEVHERGLEADERTTWDVTYLLTVDGAPFRARALLGFVQVRQLWYLESWEDTAPEPWEGRVVPTSGEARASFNR